MKIATPTADRSASIPITIPVMAPLERPEVGLVEGPVLSDDCTVPLEEVGLVFVAGTSLVTEEVATRSEVVMLGPRLGTVVVAVK
jgi:hypothetical protein